MIFTLWEIIDAIIMSLALGFIFKDTFRAPHKHYDPLAQFNNAGKIFNRDFYYAIALTAPAIILHELGHKFVAMSFGYSASFEAANLFGIPYGGVLLGVILKLAQSPILFFVPAWVIIPSGIPPLTGAIIAFSGPAVNLLLWLGSMAAIRFGKLKRNQRYFLFFTSRINMFLFIFNMIPLGFFDGSKVLHGLLGAF